MSDNRKMRSICLPAFSFGSFDSLPQNNPILKNKCAQSINARFVQPEHEGRNCKLPPCQPEIQPPNLVRLHPPGVWRRNHMSIEKGNRMSGTCQHKCGSHEPQARWSARNHVLEQEQYFSFTVCWHCGAPHVNMIFRNDNLNTSSPKCTHPTLKRYCLIIHTGGNSGVAAGFKMWF